MLSFYGNCNSMVFTVFFRLTLKNPIPAVAMKPALFEDLFNKYWTELYQYAARNLGNTADAQDLIQDLFTDLWERRDSLEVNIPMKFYLFSAVRKRILRQFRNHSLKEKHLQVHSNTYAKALHTEPLNGIIHKNMLHQVQGRLQTLPDKERRVFTLYHFDELSIREIALIQGTAEQTVRNQLNSAAVKARSMVIMR
jgi:RNA polymerase sigma factor (sigma-70 family)